MKTPVRSRLHGGLHCFFLPFLRIILRRKALLSSQNQHAFYANAHRRKDRYQRLNQALWPAFEKEFVQAKLESAYHVCA